MNALWITSMVLQWLVIALLCALVLTLIRQIGLLNVQINAIKEETLQEGPGLFTHFPAQQVPLLNGTTLSIGGEASGPALIAFFSPGCGACIELPDAVARLAKETAGAVEILAVIMTDRVTAKQFAESKGLLAADAPLRVASKDDFIEHYIPRGVPYAFALAAGGTVAARGKPKVHEHVQQMAHAAQHIADMAPSNSERKHDWGQSAPYWETSLQQAS